MPIRMVPDEPEKKQSQSRRRVSFSNRSGGLGALLPMLLSIVFKRPKILIPLLIIGAILYFGKGCLFGSENTGNEISAIASLFTGAEFDEKQYDKAEVYTPLADNINNPLPEQVSLAKYCPQRKNQGSQGSCVGWSSGYAARTIMAAMETGENPNKVAISPASVYNEISLPGCQGAYIINAMKSLQTKGALPWSDFPYDEKSCEAKMNQSGYAKAAQFRTKGFNRLTPSGDPRGVDLLAIKQNLAQGAPVVIGMMVGGSFMSAMQGRKVWHPKNSDYSMRGFGGHAMCVIGYDDYLEGGSFQIMNSWGDEWGERGIAWVKYSDFEHFTKEAYGLYPMGNADALNPKYFKLGFGLIGNATNSVISLRQTGYNTFETTTNLEKLSKFKIEVNNSIECYTYIFGMETDGSSYVLFPYTEKHSPYCGITGTRIFPRDASLQADEIGNKDFFAIVISKKPLNYLDLNTRINSVRTSNYAYKINTALSGQLKNNVQFSNRSGKIQFETDTDGSELVAMIIAVNKN